MALIRTPRRQVEAGSRLRFAGTAAALLLAATVAGCGGQSVSLPGEQSGAAPGGDSIEKALAEAPTAAPNLIPAGTTMAKIKEKGALTVGGTETAALFSLRDPMTGKLSGFDATLSQLLAKYIIGKPETKLVQVTAQTRELLLQNQTVDAVFATYTITPARAEKISFAGPYYSSGTSLLVKKDRSDIKQVTDLAGKSVATQSNSTAATTLTKLVPNAKVLLLSSNDECVQAVRQGRAEAYAIDEAILVGNVARNPELKVVGNPFTTEPYGIGLPPGDAQFKAFVNDWLRSIFASGLWERVWKLTVGTAVEGAAPTPPQPGSVAGS
ncbi:glutamate ABC transporter substrate-binding protein [Micromonospora sp. DT4]|uniref:glutamate ABC transporter substrate-binding protein n=1 Tax=Micromonospora sp. DT4 TaxID=3393438 RepID=UPI003CF0E1E4